MFCVNCGKSLVRGYQFCIECGTPVADMEEPEEGAEGMPEGTEAAPETENGSLVFCPNCGMHMQVSTAFCETCGMRLSGEESATPPPQQNYRPAVPLWNEDPLGGELSGMSDQDIDRINNFMNGVSDFGVSEEETVTEIVEENLGGDMGYSNYQPDYADLGASGNIPGATPEEIDALTAQLAQYSASAGAIPTVSAPAPQSVVSMQEEIGSGEGIRMNNFSMEAAEDEELSITDGVPIISGGSMDEDPNDTATINPYGFLDNDFGDMDTSAVAAAPTAVSAPAAESAAPTVESISPIVEDIAPAVESIAPTVEDIAPAVESITPIVEDIAPVDYTVPTVEDIAHGVEDITPVAENIVPIAESIAPAVDYSVDAESISPAPEEPAPAAEENIAEKAPVDSVEESPAVPESVPALPEQPDDDFMDYGEPYIEEGLPVIAEYTEPSAPAENIPAPVAPAAEAPVMSAPAPAAEVPELNRPKDAGRKITYCHNCGQDMFEDEEFCKNCSAPRNVALVPVSQRKSKKLVPIIAAAAVVVVGAAVTVFVLNRGDTDNVIDDSTLSVSDPVGDPIGNNAADPADTAEPDTAEATADNNAESAEENLFPPAPDTSSDGGSQTSDTEKSTKTTPKPATTPKSSAATTKATTPKPVTTPKPSTASTTPKPQTAAPKPATTTAAPATTPKPNGSTTVSSSKVTSLEKDRKAITDAVALIAGEVGKIEALAQNVVYAMENSSNGETARTAFYSRDFAKNMLSSIDSGKTAVDNAVSAAAPKNSEFDSAYDSLVTLQSKYEAYYKFIKSPSGNTSKFSSSCGTYLSGVTSYISNFKYSSLTTSSYNSNDTSLMYKSILSDAVAAANSAVSGFSSIEGSLSGLDDSGFETAVVKELSKSAVSKNYANAAANAQKVAGYVAILSGAPSEYSSAYSSLKSASSELTSLVDLLVMIQENTLDTYTESSQDGISSAKSSISKVKNAVS